MKAAVIHGNGNGPQYADVPEPVVQNDGEVLLTVRAAALKHFDKSRASGKHYSADGRNRPAAVIGGDGVGLLPDGKRVFALGVSGTVAERATVDKDRTVPLPDGLDDAVAAALPNAVAGSAMALRFRAGMKPGETVLINGATGFTGKIAVQLAKHYGAKRVIATGRNEQSLQTLLTLGADEIVSVKGADEKFLLRLKELHKYSTPDVVIDYLWGLTAELILLSLKGSGSVTHKTRFVSVGAVTGDTVRLSAENLRSVDLQLSGSGLGSWTKEEMQKLFAEIIPETFRLAAADKLKAETVKVELKDIERLWERDVPGGKRLVVMI